MGSNRELLSFAETIIESIQPTPESQCAHDNLRVFPLSNVKKVSNDVLSKLAFVFPENLILAALDLIDRENGKSFALLRIQTFTRRRLF